MEVEIDIDRSMLCYACYGCLSSDRKLTQVTGQLNTLFYQIRSDGEETSKHVFCLLCWECIAVLRKIRTFQKQTQLAKDRLMNDIPSSLSNLTTVYTESYDYIYDYDDQQELETKQALVITAPTDTFIKLEHVSSDEPQIKEEEFSINNDAFSNNDPDLIDNDSTFNDTKPNIDEMKVKVEKDVKNNKKHLTIKEYKKYATICDSNFDFKTVNIKNYTKKVCLDENKYEEYLKYNDKYRITNGPKKLVKRCKDCNKEYLRRPDLIRHISLNHDTSPFPRKCTSCKTVLNTQDEVTAHWREVHTDMLQCTLCDQACRNTTEVRTHLNRTHNKIFKCNKCEMDIPTLRQFSLHYRNTHERCVCDDCQKTFYSKKKLEKHVITRHLPTYCDLCDRKFKNHSIYTKHCSLCHSKVTDETKELSYCVECDRQFPSVYHYRRHLSYTLKHNPKTGTSVPCPECGKTFPRQSNMKKHFKIVHINVNKSNYPCNICDKYYASRSNLRQHIVSVHQKKKLPKNKMCDLCGRGFGTNRTRDNHRRTHTGERPFKCQHCPASFAQATARRTHQKTQHKNISEMSIA